MTLFVFVVLGANIPFDTLGEYFLPALAVLGALLFLARPVTVLACVLPDRRGAWTRPELAFLCWTRETGVVPAALVGRPRRPRACRTSTSTPQSSRWRS